VLDDWRTAPIDEKLRATLGLIEALTLSPEAVGPEDVARVRQAGVSNAALRDAVYVCALFNTIDRISDALDFAVLSTDGFRKAAKLLLRFGYNPPVVGL
jgi:alkylhydroperoxidase family enzyme